MPNKPNTGAANKAALKERIKSMLTMPPMSGSNPANTNPSVEVPMAPPAPVREMYGPNPPSYYVPSDRNETANTYDGRSVAYYEGGRYRGINNEEVDPGDIGYRYAIGGDPNAYEKPPKIVTRGKYATKK